MGNTDDDILSLGGRNSAEPYMDTTPLLSEKDVLGPVASPVILDPHPPAHAFPQAALAAARSRIWY